MKTPLLIALCTAPLLVAELQSPGFPNDDGTEAAPTAAEPQSRTQDEEPWSALDIDSLISHLPTVESEATWDADLRVWVPHPAVAEFQKRIENDVSLSDAQWTAALLGTGAIRIREKWPVDVPFAISMRLPRWLPHCEITMTPASSSPLSEATVGVLLPVSCGSRRLAQHAAYQDLGALSLGRHALDFAVEIKRGRAYLLDLRVQKDTFEPKTVWSGSLSFNVEVVSSLDEVLPPIRDQALTDAVARSLRINRWGDGMGNDHDALVLLGDRPDCFPVLRGVVVGVEAELWHNETLMETQQFVARVDYGADPSDPESGYLSGAEEFQTLPLDLRLDPVDQRNWYFRVRSMTDGILTAWNAQRRWEGEFTIPLSQLYPRKRQR